MQRALMWWGAALVAVVLSACGNNGITSGSTPAATPNASSTPTATFSPTIVPSSTATNVPIATATPTTTGSPTPTSTPQPAMALFSADANAAANPFPSDRLIDSTGHVQVPVTQLGADLPADPEFDAARAYITRVSGQLNVFTGFSTFAPIRVRFDQPVAVDAGENPKGLLLLQYDDLAGPPVVIRASFYEPENTIEVSPIVPLKSKTTYALVVTTALSDGNGSHVRPSPDFAALLAGGNGLSPELTAWRTRLLPVIDFVGTNYGISSDAIALVNLVTTAPTTDDLVTIQQRLVHKELVPGAPQFEDSPIGGDLGIFQAGTEPFTKLVGTATNVSEIAIGSFDSYDFRKRPNGAFDPALISGPQVPPVNHVDFYVTVPKATPPPNGYPLVIFGHGLGGSGRDVGLAVPGMVGDEPIMGIGISALQHGRRGTVTNFFVLTNISTTREYFRQTIADTVQLVRMVENAHTAGTPPFDKVDPNRIMYFGVSLGGIMGTMFMAVEPDVRVGMLSVPGGGLPNIIDSHDIGNLLEPLIGQAGGIPRDAPLFPRFFHRFQQMSQWTTDAADPINYAPHMIDPGQQLTGVPPKRILMHEGITDNTVPNRTTDDLALAMRLPDLNVTRGCTDPDGCAGIWRFVMTDYGQGELSGHGVSFLVPQAREQVKQFLSSYGTVVPDGSPQ